jgi:membrane fusion protein, multidrug efflux system
MKTSGKISIILFITAIILGTTYKLNSVKRNKKEETNIVNKAKSDVPVTVFLAQCSNTSYNILYHGTFEPNYEVTVVSEAQGKVKEYSIEEGTFVLEGKVMACLENDITSYQIEAAEAVYQKAQSDLNRFENLSSGEAVSVQQLEEVKLALKNAKSSYLTLKKQYENTFVKAPVLGTISKRYFERGAFIAQGAPVADIIDTRKMKFIAWFNATDLARVKIGQQVKITTDLYPNVSYDGIIKIISIKPDESKRYRIQTEVQNNLTRPLISGTDGTLVLSLKQDQKNIAIPRNCIVGSVIEPTVYVVEGGEAKLRPVVIAEFINGQAIISNGLKEGDQVVLSGQINIQDGAKVNVLNAITL